MDGFPLKPKTFSFPFQIFEGFDLENKSVSLSLKKDSNFLEDLLNHQNFVIITKGIVIIYWKDDYGNSTIIDFKTIGQVLRPGIEINENNIGIMHATAHTDVNLISINANFLCSCSFESKSISDFYFGALTNDLNSTYQQLKLLKEADLEKRYKTFLKAYKYIYNDISDRLIANYLGVHYTTLARLKAKALYQEGYKNIPDN